MPPASRAFRIRHYECDAYGHLNNTAYLRYLEEVEVAAGRVPTELRRVDLHYERPLGFGDTVEVTVQPAGRGAFVYGFEHPDGQAALAFGEWGDAGVLGSVPDAPPPPAAPFRYERRVGWRDVAASGLVNPSTYAALVEDAAMELCAHFGWPMERCTAAGFAIVVRRHRIVYHRPLRLGEDYAVTTFASDRSYASATRHYLVDDAAGGPVARFASEYVWVHPEKQRPVRIPADFLADFAANFSP